MATLSEVCREKEAVILPRHRRLPHRSAHSSKTATSCRYLYPTKGEEDTHRYLCLNSLIASLDADPDFAQVPQQKRAQYTVCLCCYRMRLRVLFQRDWKG